MPEIDTVVDRPGLDHCRKRVRGMLVGVAGEVAERFELPDRAQPAAHFATEEARGGGFETLVSAVPKLRARVDQIFEDHKWLRAEVGALLDLVEAGVSANAFAERVKVFVEKVVDHEVRESKLLRKLAQL